MAPEHISPELALVDPDLAARARLALSTAGTAVPTAAGRPAPSPPAPTNPPSQERDRHYPLWARVTAALWLLVIGILVGGAAIPHAQDKPRVIQPNDDAVVTVCKTSKPSATLPPLRGHLGGS